MRYYFILIILFSAVSTPAQTGRALVWSDEFDYSGLPDSTKWTAEIGGHGWGNNELQYYTRGRLENARVANGILTIEARKENMEGKKYTSARLITRNKGEWQYGRIDVRAKLPRGLGTWPAIWMLGATKPLKWPDDGELDIMEHVGYDHGVVHASVHTRKYHHSINTQKTNKITIPDVSETFHVYSIDWNADSVKVLVDDKVFFTFGNEKTGYEAWPFDNPMFLILNVAVGGNWGGAKGVDETIWPRSMEVDYVRVYR